MDRPTLVNFRASSMYSVLLGVSTNVAPDADFTVKSSAPPSKFSTLGFGVEDLLEWSAMRTHFAFRLDIPESPSSPSVSTSTLLDCSVSIRGRICAFGGSWVESLQRSSSFPLSTCSIIVSLAWFVMSSSMLRRFASRSKLFSAGLFKGFEGSGKFEKSGLNKNG